MDSLTRPQTESWRRSVCPKEQDILLAQRNASAAPPSPTHTEERNTLSFLCVFLMAQAKGPLSLPWLLELLRQPSFPPLTSVFWRRACLLSHVQLFVTPQTAAHQAPLSTGFSRQQYWSGLPCPSPGDFPDPGIGPTSLVSPALAGGLFTTAPPGKAPGKP